jgi:hypothetical protein
MARVWLVYEGYPNTVGPPSAVLPLDDAVRLFDLKPQHLLSDLSRPPRFGDPTRDFTWLGYRYVVVEVGDGEAGRRWKAGFYKSPVSPEDALRRLLRHQIALRIGDDWRVELEEGRDADGDRGLWAWIKLKQEAPESAWRLENRQHIEKKIRETVAESGVSSWVFVRFRKEVEERAAS